MAPSPIGPHHRHLDPLTPRIPPWVDDALCAQIDHDLFYPERGHKSPEAIRICNTCPVRHQCLTDALANDEAHGIWGGLTPNQRLQLTEEQ